jgi:hypothetical protein
MKKNRPTPDPLRIGRVNGIKIKIYIGALRNCCPILLPGKTQVENEICIPFLPKTIP